DAILPMALDEDSSGIVAKELKAEGIEIRTSNTAQEVEGKDGQPTACLLQDGSRVECDVLVVAVGVRPNVDFVRDSGIEIDQGIVVNLKMETSIEDIYAAGDCAQGPEIITGKTMAIPVIPVASTHGYVAGCNMVGEDSTYVGGLSLNAIQFGGIQAISYGFVKDETDAEVMRVRDDNKNIYKKIIIRDGRITGALFLTDIDRAGLYRHLVENQIDVTSFKEHLLDDDFGIGHLPLAEREAMFTVDQ
ncbi:MAG: FAD-dependent oxidoreductase, partial [Candidatus Latescibacteria bacterium]|nr:FAD-dependent oxidoreductase [Candidatus Latescibacterota bacterium]